MPFSQRSAKQVLDGDSKGLRNPQQLEVVDLPDSQFHLGNLLTRQGGRSGQGLGQLVDSNPPSDANLPDLRARDVLPVHVRWIGDLCNPD